MPQYCRWWALESWPFSPNADFSWSETVWTTKNSRHFRPLPGLHRPEVANDQSATKQPWPQSIKTAAIFGWFNERGPISRILCVSAFVLSRLYCGRVCALATCDNFRTNRTMVLWYYGTFRNFGMPVRLQAARKYGQSSSRWSSNKNAMESPLEGFGKWLTTSFDFSPKFEFSNWKDSNKDRGLD